MQRTIKKTAARLAIGFALLLPIIVGVTACNTTAGAGKDISATGNAVSNAATSAKSSM